MSDDIRMQQVRAATQTMHREMLRNETDALLKMKRAADQLLTQLQAGALRCNAVWSKTGERHFIPCAAWDRYRLTFDGVNTVVIIEPDASGKMVPCDEWSDPGFSVDEVFSIWPSGAGEP